MREVNEAHKNTKLTHVVDLSIKSDIKESKVNNRDYLSLMEEKRNDIFKNDDHAKTRYMDLEDGLGHEWNLGYAKSWVSMIDQGKRQIKKALPKEEVVIKEFSVVGEDNIP